MATQTIADSVEQVKMLCGGQWRAAGGERSSEVYNPSTGQVIAKVPFCTAAEVDEVVQAAAQALPAWAETPVVERAQILFRFRELIKANFDELAQCLTREHGKTLAESRASVQRGVEMVEFACSTPSLIMGQCIENIAPNVDS